MKIQAEVWKNIPDWPNYMASSFGRIKSIIKNTGHQHFKQREYILKQHLPKRGYYQVVLHNNTQKRTFEVHRLIALSHILNIENKPMVNHKDGNKKNNNILNLEWVTASENSKHAWETGLQKITPKKLNAIKQQGINNGKKVNQYNKVGVLINTYYSASEAARNLGITHTTVVGICNQKKGSKKYFFTYA